MASPGADIAEAPQQFGRIDRTAVDRRGEGRKVSTRNGSNLIDDRCRPKVGVLVDR
jgi:hypothetical protein